MQEITSAYKVAHHKEKLESYLRREQIMPATLELDISTECNRRCSLCPSTTSPRSSTLSLDFVERLFTRLDDQTKGLLLSGGEPTLAPIFPEVLHLARRHGFVDIATVTNGSLLDREDVAAALCTDASTIRVSVYDWTKERPADLKATLRRITDLRSRIEASGSQLQIGVSLLTSKENASTVDAIAQKFASAGAHWVYFHPMCIRWEVGAPERVDQSGVLEKIKECQAKQSNTFHVFTFPDRYIERKIEFSGYHAAHFLLVVGADGMNYLGAEVKYHPQYIIADLARNWHDDFLWSTERLNRIRSVNSRTYPAIASRHRGVMYSQTIQDLIDNGARSLDHREADTYLFPHIL